MGATLAQTLTREPSARRPLPLSWERRDVDNTCVQKCNDDQSRTLCKTDLDNCTASCGGVSVTSQKPDGE
jgi:hypothetical protein